MRICLAKLSDRTICPHSVQGNFLFLFDILTALCPEANERVNDFVCFMYVSLWYRRGTDARYRCEVQMRGKDARYKCEVQMRGTDAR